MSKQYLAELSLSDTASASGVYADFDGEHIVLTTENSISISNTIYLDSSVWSALKIYVERHPFGCGVSSAELGAYPVIVVPEEREGK